MKLIRSMPPGAPSSFAYRAYASDGWSGKFSRELTEYLSGQLRQAQIFDHCVCL